MVKNFVVEVAWADIQPNGMGSPIVTNSVGTVTQHSAGSMFKDANIDDAIAQAIAHGWFIKLRVDAGASAPGWLKAACSVAITDYTAPHGAQSFTAPCWWTPEVLAAFTDLQTQLAQRYDDNDRILSIGVTMSMTQFPEPLLRQNSGIATTSPPWQNARAYWDAAHQTNGPSADFVALDRAAHVAAMQAMLVWKRTHVEFSFNPAQRIPESAVADGHITTDEVYTEQLMDTYRQIFGAQALFHNESIRASYLTATSGPYYSMYQHMKAANGSVPGGIGVSFQTGTPAQIGSPWQDAIRFGIDVGALNIELPATSAGYVTWSSAAEKQDLVNFAQQLEMAPAP